ncbi:hypothetical protein HY633_01480 [Candidatus Uhrbacteria bacterium]|nr:hypothetical protein [Candidatus Uhrbacteria bacterium]
MKRRYSAILASMTAFSAVAIAAVSPFITQEGPGGSQLTIDERLPFKVPRPGDLPLIASGEMTLEELTAEGLHNWFFDAQLDGEPFGVPAEVFDFYAALAPPAEHTMVFELIEPFVRTGLSKLPGDKLPRGFVRISRPEPLITQNCSACHSGVVNGMLIPGLGNKWYNQKAIIQNAKLMMESSIPLLQAGGSRSADILRRTERQLAKLRRYEALYGVGCDDLGPGMITAARIWEISSKLLRDPAQLATPEGQKRFPCGATKPPPLNTLRFRNLLFWDGSVNSQWVAHWPMFDFFGFDDYDHWTEKVKSRSIQAVDAFLVFATPSPSWRDIMRTRLDSTAAKAGHGIFHRPQSCASCHGTYGEDGMLKTFGSAITPLEVIGTDPERAVAAFDELMAEFTKYGWAFVPRIQGLPEYVPGYAPSPLCSPFLNFPYLHTAGVANLHELLLPEERRRRDYWQSDIIDEKHVGFYAAARMPKRLEFQPPHAVLRRTFPDAKVRGHSGPRFGTALSEPERMQLIEFMKTMRCPEEAGAGPPPIIPLRPR